MKIFQWLAFLFILLPLNLTSQVWKVLVNQDFGTVANTLYNNTNPASLTPLADIQSIVVPGSSITSVSSDYLQSPQDKIFACNDGYFTVTTDPDFVDNFSHNTYSINDGPWIKALDHTIDLAGTNGRMAIFNANPARLGIVNGSYVTYEQTGAVPGANYRFSFFSANLLLPSHNGWKPGYLGLDINSSSSGSLSTSLLTNSLTYTLPFSPNNTTLSWQLFNPTFTLPLNYTSNKLYFNFYNWDPNTVQPSQPNLGNDLAIDDIKIEMLVSQLSGKIFIDNNADGIQDAIDASVNGSSYPLYVYCVDINNNIASKVQVKPDGTYLLDTTTGVPYSNTDIGLKIIISSNNYNAGDNLVSSIIKNRVTVSENVSFSNQPTYLNTGSVDGIINLKKTDVDLTNINFGIRPLCYKTPATSGSVLVSKQGVTSLGRAGSSHPDNWPMVRNGAWTVLESKTKGLVINRLSTSQINGLSPILGMIVYDTTVNCLKLYSVKDGDAAPSWNCLTTQTCPD